MSPIVPTVSYLLALATVGAQILALILLGIAIQGKKLPKLTTWVTHNAYTLGYMTAMVAMLGSLFYSDIAGYAPCKLCWYQRILMYPMALLFFVAALKKDRMIFVYTGLMSLVGGAIALYHYLLQLGIVPELNCAVTGYSAKCSDRFVMTFGYVTIPVMALSAFAVIGLVSLIAYRHHRHS